MEEGSILYYLEETPEKLINIIDNVDQNIQNIDSIKNINRIILIGSGTSCYAGIQASDYIQKLTNIETFCIYPFELEKFLINNPKNTLVIGISQSGSSATTIEALKYASSKGAMTGTVTEDESLKINKVADVKIYMNVGDELASTKTKGYYSTIISLMCFGLKYAKINNLIDENTYNREINYMIESIDIYKKFYKTSLKWALDNKKILSKSKDIKILGSKMFYGSILESSLKLLESLRVPVAAYEVSEFIHGIYNAINKDTSIIIFYNKEDKNIYENLYSILKEWTDNIYLINHHNGLEMPENKDEYMSSLYNILPIQILSQVAAEEKGINPSIAKDPNFHKKMNSK